MFQQERPVKFQVIRSQFSEAVAKPETYRILPRRRDTFRVGLSKGCDLAPENRSPPGARGGPTRVPGWHLLGDDPMEAKGKLIWQQGERTAKVHYSIPYVGELNLEVSAALPGAGVREPAEEQRDLALRHVRLLLRNLMNALDRHCVDKKSPG